MINYLRSRKRKAQRREEKKFQNKEERKREEKKKIAGCWLFVDCFFLYFDFKTKHINYWSGS